VVRVASVTVDEQDLDLERGVGPCSPAERDPPSSRPSGIARIEGAAASDAHRQRLSRALTEHYDFVWRSLRRLGVPDSEAEDAAQEVFLVLSGRLGDVVPGSERAFLYRVAVHKAEHVHRARARRREVAEPAPDEAPASTRDPEQLLAGARARALCHELLGELSLEQRAVFVLYELEEMTMAEIAETLQLPMGTVASRLRRGRETFGKRLQERLNAGDG
jgi:RNA polymerase sigma-70 factor, ECF subfamily